MRERRSEQVLGDSPTQAHATRPSVGVPGILLLCVRVIVHIQVVLQKRMHTAEACGPEQETGSNGDLNQRVLTTPKLRQETGSCTGRLQLSRCTFHGGIGPCLASALP
ncbi:hypothetical protein E2C01_081965 [Portunus trituberculatus]|uniref:Uncharacterized protein n=1 Tax=Portunus trituberculatus TaxID=210409 RepID=A0A5B7IY03_PORTR|nr:hypothetical protein [Portunus trituberculatus]